MDCSSIVPGHVCLITPPQALVGLGFRAMVPTGGTAVVGLNPTVCKYSYILFISDAILVLRLGFASNTRDDVKVTCILGGIGTVTLGFGAAGVGAECCTSRACGEGRPIMSSSSSRISLSVANCGTLFFIKCPTPNSPEVVTTNSIRYEATCTQAFSPFTTLAR